MLCLLFGSVAYGTETEGYESMVVLERPMTDTGLSLSFSYGYQDVAMSGEFLPVEIGIRNSSAGAIEGSLELEAKDGEGDAVIYSYGLSLEPGAQTSIRSTISIPDETGDMVLRIVDGEGQVIYSEQEEILIHGDGSELLIGLLSNRPDSLSYLRGVSLADQSLSTRTVTLSPNSLPETREGLEQLDAIVISDFNMGRLSEGSIDAIYQWVENGGVLLLGTGRSADTAESFAGYIEGLEISDASEQEINMGMQYSTEGPDGAVLSLTVREVYASEGIQSMQSGNLGVLTYINAGSGVIGITAYSLCDISDFCFEQLGYVEELLTSLFGNARLRQAGKLRGEDNSPKQTVRELTDVADGSRLPDMMIYLFIAGIYVLICGPAAYFYLRGKGLSAYYPFGAVVCSFAAMLVIWLCSLGTRYESDFADYASIRHISGDTVNETVFLKLSSSKKGDIDFNIPSGDIVMPVMEGGSEGPWRSLRDGDRTVRLSGFDGTAEDGLKISEKLSEASKKQPSSEEAHSEKAPSGELSENSSSENTAESLGHIHISAESPFSESYFEIIKRNNEGLKDTDISLELSCFEDEIYGEIVNDTSMKLYDVSLLLFGRIISVGDIEAGERRSLDGLSTVYGPTGSAALTSEFITGIDRMDRTEEDYGLKLKETNLLSYYLEESLGYYYQGVRLVGFVRDGLSEDALFSDNDIEASGISLIALSEDADLSNGSRVYKSALSEEPRIVSGNYDVASNTISGTTSAVIEYKLGTDIRVLSVRLNALSESFHGRLDEGGRMLIPFTGAMSMYNYITGGYDLIDSGKTEFTEEEIRPYMSPENAIMVRFIPDENTEDNNVMFLPVPMVTGVSL